MERTQTLPLNLNANSALSTPIHPPRVLMQKANVIVALQAVNQPKPGRATSLRVRKVPLDDMEKQAVSSKTAKPERIKMKRARPLVNLV